MDIEQIYLTVLTLFGFVFLISLLIGSIFKNIRWPDILIEKSLTVIVASTIIMLIYYMFGKIK